MMTSPATTGSDPRSPERTRSTKAATAPPTPVACLTRISLRSSSVDGGGLSCAPRCGAPCVSWLMIFLRLGVLFCLAPAGAARHGVLGGAGDRRHQLLIRGVGKEEAVVSAKAQHHDPIGHGAHVLHV